MKNKCLWMCCLLFCGSLFPLHVWGDARSIQAFVEAEQQWENTIGASWKLEGRYSLIGTDNLRFINCSMPFYFGPEVTRPPGRFINLEVTGKIERRDGKLVFLMDSLRAVPNDQERIVIQKGLMDPNKPEQWYELATWASTRAKFYDDRKLRETALELQLSGLQREFLQLDPQDHAGLEALVKRGRDFGLQESILREFLHHGYWQRFRALENRETREASDRLAELLLTISKDLPGARKPLATFVPEQSARYLEQPQEVFVQAEANERQTLERLFYLDVAKHRILRRVDPTGKNAALITKDLQREAPERIDLIEESIQRGLKYELERVPLMARQELLDLTRRLEERQELREAEGAKRRWLDARQSLYQEDGPRGLVDFADEWIQLLNDRETAAKYYIAAWKQNPQYPLALNWLTDNGYALHKGEWVRAELLPPPAESRMEKAIREGRIELGMTTVQVKSAMGLAPDSLVRLATSGRVTELWTYESAGIVVQFTWSIGSNSSQVASIKPLRSTASPAASAGSPSPPASREPKP